MNNNTAKEQAQTYGKVSLNGCQLYKGDCLEVMDYLISIGIKVDFILTDPPYG